jgi:hypothetical protein
MDTIARSDHHGHGGLTPIRPARREAEAPIAGSPTGQGDMNEPGDEIDLGTWIFGLSNVDHRACTAGHHGVGTYAVEQSGVVNVESVGCPRSVQHTGTDHGPGPRAECARPRARPTSSSQLPVTVAQRSSK